MLYNYYDWYKDLQKLDQHLLLLAILLLECAIILYLLPALLRGVMPITIKLEEATTPLAPTPPPLCHHP